MHRFKAALHEDILFGIKACFQHWIKTLKKVIVTFSLSIKILYFSTLNLYLIIMSLYLTVEFISHNYEFISHSWVYICNFEFISHNTILISQNYWGKKAELWEKV